VSHVTSDDSDPDAVNAIRAAYAGASAPTVFRTAERIGDFFDGFRLDYPGIVDVSQWRPLPGMVAPEFSVRVLGGVGKK
jgi:hypothetical protein